MADIQSRQKLSQKDFFKINKYEKLINCQIFKNLTLGIDPKLFTPKQISNFFLKYNNIKEIELNLIDTIFNKYSIKSKPFFSLNQNIVGESHRNKIDRLTSILKNINPIIFL